MKNVNAGSYVFDASAILRFLDFEAGWEDVRGLFEQSERQECNLLMSAINWGEVAGKLYKRVGQTLAKDTLADLLSNGLRLIDASPQRAIAAAILSARLHVSYADAFGIELASAPNHILVTADYGAKPAEQEVRIQFLPAKSQA